MVRGQVLSICIFKFWQTLSQRWEHCTADLTFSTKEVTSVWYSISAMEVSLFLTGQSGEGRPSQCARVATWWLYRHSNFKEDTQDVGYPYVVPVPALLSLTLQSTLGNSRTDKDQEQHDVMWLWEAVLRCHWVTEL